MSEHVQRFEEFNASANPTVNEKRKVEKKGNYKLIKITSKDPNVIKYKLKSKKGAELMKSDGHLQDKVFTFLQGEMDKEMFTEAKSKLKKVKNRRSRDTIVFEVTRKDKKGATEDDIKKTTGEKETPKETPEKNILTVEEPIKVGTEQKPVALIKQEIVGKFEGTALAKTDAFKKVDNDKESDKHDVNSGAIIKALKVGFGTILDKATTDIDKDIVDKLVAEEVTESVSESHIFDYDKFMDNVYEAFDMDAAVSSLEPIVDIVDVKTKTKTKTDIPTSSMPANLKGTGKVKAFQVWVINTKKNKTILGGGGDTGFGDDGKWGPNTSAAWKLYGNIYSPDSGATTDTSRLESFLQKNQKAAKLAKLLEYNKVIQEAWQNMYNVIVAKPDNYFSEFEGWNDNEAGAAKFLRTAYTDGWLKNAANPTKSLNKIKGKLKSEFASSYYKSHAATLIKSIDNLTAGVWKIANTYIAKGDYHTTYAKGLELKNHYVTKTGAVQYQKVYFKWTYM